MANKSDKYLVIVNDCDCGTFVVNVKGSDVFVSEEPHPVSYEKKEKIIAKLKQQKIDFEVVKA